MSFVLELKLKVPIVTHADKADFLTELAANDKDYKNLAIVDTNFEWYDPAAPPSWENLVLLTFWKKTKKLLKVKISIVYKELQTEFRACLLNHVAVKATENEMKMPFDRDMINDYAHIGDAEVP